MVMYKITRGDEISYTQTYPEAEKIFNRVRRRKYPCWEYTRLYCDLGEGYQLMTVAGKRLNNAFL